MDENHHQDGHFSVASLPASSDGRVETRFLCKISSFSQPKNLCLIKGETVGAVTLKCFSRVFSAPKDFVVRQNSPAQKSYRIVYNPLRVPSFEELIPRIDPEAVGNPRNKASPLNSKVPSSC